MEQYRKTLIFQMTRAIFILCLIWTGLSSSYLLKPLGSCLGNCRHCDKLDLQLCRGLSGSICSLGYSQRDVSGKCLPDQVHRDQIKQFDEFVEDPMIIGWNNKDHENCQYPGHGGQIHKFNILGFFSASSKVQKNFPIKSYHRSAIVSFNVVRNAWEPFNDYLVVVLKTGSKILSTNEVSCDQLAVTDKDPFRCHGIPFKLEKYQLEAVLGEHSDTDLTVSFESNMKNQSVWGLTNLHLLIGCAKFIVPGANGQCKTCESGFYKIQQGTEVKRCQRCPGVCLECTNATVCTKCVEGMQAYNNQCYYLKKYNKTSITLPSDTKCENIAFIKSNDGVVQLSELTIPEHTHLAISFSIFYDPNVWDDSAEIHIYVNEVQIHQFKRNQLKTFSTGQCDFFPSKVFQHEKLTTPYHENSIEKLKLKFKAIKNGKNIEYGLNTEGIHFLQYLCTPNCLKCNRNLHECTQCKQGFKMDAKKQCIPLQQKTNLQQKQPIKEKAQIPGPIPTPTPTPIPTPFRIPYPTKQNTQTQQQGPTLSQNSVQTQSKIQVQFYPENYVKTQQSGVTLRLNYPEQYKINNFKVAVDKFPGIWLPITSLQIHQQLQEITVQIDDSFVQGILGLYLDKTNVTRPTLITPNQIQYLTDDQQYIEHGSRYLQTFNASDYELLKKWEIERYDYLAPQDAKQIFSIGYILAIFVWISLIGVMVCVPFNKGIIWEQLILTLQVLFLHSFIYSEYLPLTIKNPLNNLSRIESLNFFLAVDAKKIESFWVGNFIQDSPLRFIQNKADINFTRAFYAIIIINVLFALWFFINFVIYKALKRVEHKSEWQLRLKRLTSRIATRKINYFDQIWRYQFLATLWACFLQFYNLSYPLTADRSAIPNAILCFISLICTIAWPIFVSFYTHLKKEGLQKLEFNDYFEDIYYGRACPQEMPTLQQTLYLPFRYIKYLFYAIAASGLGKYPLGAFIPIIILQIAEIVYILSLRVYKDRIYLVSRIIENSFLTIIAVLMIIVYAISTFVNKTTYLQIGYAVYGIMLITAVNAVVRAIYIMYTKAKEFFEKKKTVSEKDIEVDAQVYSEAVQSQRFRSQR